MRGGGLIAGTGTQDAKHALTDAAGKICRILEKKLNLRPIPTEDPHKLI